MCYFWLKFVSELIFMLAVVAFVVEFAHISVEFIDDF